MNTPDNANRPVGTAQPATNSESLPQDPPWGFSSTDIVLGVFFGFLAIILTNFFRGEQPKPKSKPEKGKGDRPLFLVDEDGKFVSTYKSKGDNNE